VRTQQLLEKNTWPSPDPRFSGFSFAIGHAGHEPEMGFGGRKDANLDASPIASDTRFDLASITKLYTATIAATLHAKGEIDISAPLSSWADVSATLGDLTSVALLTHTSGLPPTWEERDTREGTIQALHALVPEHTQRGTLVYSCTGYSLFAVSLEKLLGKRFDQIMGELLLDPLGLDATGYLPRLATENIAMSCEPGEGLDPGVVHDPRARAMDGVSGNAGLFSTARDVSLFLSEVATGSAGVINDDARKVLFSPLVTAEWQQSVGFRYRDIERVGAQAQHFSHTGFTGTMAMVDPSTGHIAVVLANRLVCGTSREQMALTFMDFAASVLEST